jgi:hypothetical protein
LINENGFQHVVFVMVSRLPASRHRYRNKDWRAWAMLARPSDVATVSRAEAPQPHPAPIWCRVSLKIRRRVVRHEHEGCGLPIGSTSETSRSNLTAGVDGVVDLVALAQAD